MCHHKVAWSIRRCRFLLAKSVILAASLIALPPRQLAASARCCLSWCSCCCWSTQALRTSWAHICGLLSKKSSPRVHLVSTFFWLQKHHLTVFKLVPISFCLISKPPFSGGCNCWSPSCEETNKQIKQILWTEVGLLHCRHVLCMLAASTPCPSRVGPADQTCDIVDDQDKGHCTGRETSQWPVVLLRITIFLFQFSFF